ncbi:MAG: hypothetical protein EP334_02285 [Gammaproteobacteria bacterium]|nr:MAG: hypothetical protein EP334_02285 [Gammaproteobacteria bacterium]
MDRPEVERGDWIMLKASGDSGEVEARVYNVHDDGTLFVGYHQGSFKTMKAWASWNGEYWQVIDKS